MKEQEYKLTEEMQKTFDLIENTTDCLYITGKAGTGKTTFLKYIKNNTTKNYVVAASTGVAAVNAGGVTLHRLFGIPLNIQDPNGLMNGKMEAGKMDLFSSLELLIIDEISMVRPDTMDYIDKKLKLYRMNELPFGGVQVVMFGDLYQLPPVIKSAEKEILLMSYRGVYFYYAHVFRDPGFKVIELSHVFRQQDERFVEILNNIRTYKITNRDIEDLEAVRDRRASKRFDNQHIHICAFRKDVQKINSEMLGEPTHTFEAKFSGDFNQSAAPCDLALKLRIGARIMMLTNDKDDLYYNGSMGEVTKLTKKTITVHLDNGNDIEVTKHKWTAVDYKTKEGKTEAVEIGTCEQFPLTLAWAITIHKSQGLTFDNIVIHAGYLFCPGQLYVALSRCTSMKGIISESFIGKSNVIPDKEIASFDRACKKCGNVFNKITYRSMSGLK